MSGLLKQHLRNGLKSGDWTGLQAFLSEEAYVSEETIKARFEAKSCIGCGRDPCDSCGVQGPLFCEVCWNTIHKNCPEGMVVSGLLQVMQKLTSPAPPQGSSPEACMERLLRLETLEDAVKIRAELEENWQDDWPGAFGRAARKVLE